jgi:hypothetical protein
VLDFPEIGGENLYICCQNKSNKAEGTWKAAYIRKAS